jgi:uncharacterized membrane protein YhaH (DUF805 family)
MMQANPYAAPTADLLVDNDGSYGNAQIFSFSARAGRLRYLARMGIFTLASYLVFGFAFVAQATPDAVNSPSFWSVNIAYLIVSIFFGVMFGLQRLHDLDRKGWWLLLSFVPLVNVALGIYLTFGRGTQGANAFGAPPPPNTLGVKLAACIFPLLLLLMVVGVATQVAQLAATN